MSRRSGKAASRRARQQRRSKRAASPGSSTARPAAAAPGPGPALGGPEPAPPAAPSAAPAPVNPRPFASAGSVASTSRLGEAARAEYHYVARDLRNTGILVVLMAALLGVAAIVVNLAGIGPG